MEQSSSEAIKDAIQSMNRAREEREFRVWYTELLTLTPDWHRELKSGWKADVEIQPLRWMDAGLNLIQSAKVTAYVQLIDGMKGSPMQAFLPYPVFHAGTEIFLKGMWLCQYEDCRRLDSSSYVAPTRRNELLNELKTTLGHDVIKIIDAVRRIPEYAKDGRSIEFLALIDALVRRDYFPLFEADVRGNEWSSSRYPKRFYNDGLKQGSADSFNSYPSQSFVERLFVDEEDHVDLLWGLRSGLSKQRS